MASVLVVFESKYGQASKIAEHIGEMTRRHGLDARVMEVDMARAVDLRGYEAVAVVAPIYFGHHGSHISAFVRSHAQLLSARRTALFSVSNSAAATAPATREEAMRVARDFATSASWSPEIIATVAGAIAYPRYNFLLRFVMKHIAGREGQPTDTRKTHELTDWPALDRVIQNLVSPWAVSSTARAAPPPSPPPPDAASLAAPLR